MNEREIACGLYVQGRNNSTHVTRECGPEATLRDFVTESLKKKENNYRKFEKRTMFCKLDDRVDWISGPVSNRDLSSTDM